MRLHRFHVTSIVFYGLPEKPPTFRRFEGDSYQDAAKQMALYVKQRLADMFGIAPPPVLLVHHEGSLGYTGAVYIGEDASVELRKGDPSNILVASFIIVSRDANKPLYAPSDKKITLASNYRTKTGAVEASARLKEAYRNGDDAAQAAARKHYNEVMTRMPESQAMKTYEIYDIDSPFSLKLGGTNRTARARNAKEAARKFVDLIKTQIIRDKLVTRKGDTLYENEKITIVRHKYRMPHFKVTAGVLGPFLDFKVRVKNTI
jgi:hypothetical protein